MARKATRCFVNKKNSGAEVALEFFYQAHSDLTSVEKIRVEEWLKRQATVLLTSFHLEFPEI